MDSNMDKLPSLIHQTEHELRTIPSPTMPESKLFRQRDCVENMVRNILNFCIFYSNGSLRPGAEEKFLRSDVNPKLFDFFLKNNYNINNILNNALRKSFEEAP